MLSSLTEAYPRQLARAVGVDSQRLRWMMEGHLPEYSPSLSLFALGLAKEEVREGRRLYVITTKGRRKARSIAARMARLAEQRAARQKERAGHAGAGTPDGGC